MFGVFVPWVMRSIELRCIIGQYNDRYIFVFRVVYPILKILWPTRYLCITAVTNQTTYTRYRTHYFWVIFIQLPSPYYISSNFEKAEAILFYSYEFLLLAIHRWLYVLIFTRYAVLHMRFVHIFWRSCIWHLLINSWVYYEMDPMRMKRRLLGWLVEVGCGSGSTGLG